MKGVGPMCMQTDECPAGYRNDLVSCFKPKPYDRGVGYPLWEKNQMQK